MTDDQTSNNISRRDFFAIFRPEAASEEQQNLESPQHPHPSSRIIQRLEELGLSLAPISEQDQRLRVQCAGADEVKNEHVRLLRPLAPRIGELDLGNTRVGDEGLRVLRLMDRLTRLHLERTRTTDEGLEHVGPVQTLTYLNLFDTAVSDQGLEHLTGLTKLETLFLGQTDVTDEGVDQLRARLPEAEIQSGF